MRFMLWVNTVLRPLGVAFAGCALSGLALRSLPYWAAVGILSGITLGTMAWAGWWMIHQGACGLVGSAMAGVSVAMPVAVFIMPPLAKASSAEGAVVAALGFGLPALVVVLGAPVALCGGLYRRLMDAEHAA